MSVRERSVERKLQRVGDGEIKVTREREEKERVGLKETDEDGVYSYIVD